MSRQSNTPDTIERTLMAVLLVLIILLSPVSNVWAALNAPWYSPYLAWSIIILLSWLLQRHIKMQP